MDDLLNRLENKIDKLDERLDSIDRTLIAQKSSLDHHIYRTELAEENIELLRKDMKPVQNHVQFVKNVMKFLVGVGAIITFVIGLLEFFKS
jgi:archaellum component FlaC